MGAQPATAKICFEKQRLSDEVILAVRGFVHLQSQEIEATIGVRPDVPLGFADAIRAARTKWDDAKDAYIRHVAKHGC